MVKQSIWVGLNRDINSNPGCIEAPLFEGFDGFSDCVLLARADYYFGPLFGTRFSNSKTYSTC